MRRTLTVAVLTAGAALAAASILVRDVWDDDTGNTTQPGLEVRTVEAGQVTVKIQPRRIDADGAVFAITLDTHSDELSTDLAATARFVVGGTEWPVGGWSGDGPGGHHREGELRFDPAGPVTGSAQLALSGFAEPVDATWEIGG